MRVNNVLIDFHEKTADFSFVFIGLSLIVYPALLLLVPKINGLIFGLFAIAGLFLIFKQTFKVAQISDVENRLFFSVVAFFLVSLAINVYGGFTYKIMGKYLHILLFIPVYIFLRYNGLKLFSLWYGLVIGAIVAACIAVYEVFVLGYGRAHSLTHPIVFGDLALLLGVMSLAGLGWFKQRSQVQVIWPFLALISGMIASVLSVSRGSWVAVPFFVMVLFWYIKGHFTSKQLLSSGLILVMLLIGVYLLPQTQVSHHVGRTIENIQQYSDSEITSNKRATSVGTRFEMWQASWKMFLDNPFMGVGWGHYREQAAIQVKQGLRNRSAASFDHPHNEYFFALASVGSIGFIALMVLFLVPAWIFIKYIKQGKTANIKRLALAGLVLIVAYMAFGITEPLLYRSRTVNFFAFYLAVFMAAIYDQNKKAENSES